jgi:hypothetical protein
VGFEPVCGRKAEIVSPVAGVAEQAVESGGVSHLRRFPALRCSALKPGDAVLVVVELGFGGLVGITDGFGDGVEFLVEELDSMVDALVEANDVILQLSSEFGQVFLGDNAGIDVLLQILE